MQMNDTEIVSSYKRAESKSKQITILSELNACSKKDIEKVLKKAGVLKTSNSNTDTDEDNIDNDTRAGNASKEATVTLEPIYDQGNLTDDDFNNGMSLPEYCKYRTADELLTEPDDMTSEERERLERIKAIPDEVRIVINREINEGYEKVLEIEKRVDVLLDFLNGEPLCKS